MLLCGASGISGIRYNKIRIFIAACFGGIYSGISLIGTSYFLGLNYVRVLVLGIITMIAFGINKHSIKTGIVFTILNFSLEGTLQMINQSDEITATICACAISILCKFVIREAPVRKRLISVIINHRGKIVRIKALYDTGNSLVDPISGEKMLVLSHRIASVLTGLTKEELAEPVNTLHEGRVKGLWLVPFSSVGNTNGLMLAMRFPNAKLDGKRTGIVAALAAEGLEDYDALIGG